MKDFPAFIKNPENKIKKSSRHTPGSEGFVFDGKDNSQIVCWTCYAERVSAEPVHDFEEYLVCVNRQCAVTMNNERIMPDPGDELLIPGGVLRGGALTAGTRTIHAFGGKRIHMRKDGFRTAAALYALLTGVCCISGGPDYRSGNLPLFEDEEAVIIEEYSDDAMEPFISNDSGYLFFTGNPERTAGFTSTG